MTFDVMERIRELSAVGKLIVDPDKERYPHLFKTYRFTEQELAEHRANYKSKPRREYGSKGNLSANEDAPETEARLRYVPVGGVFKVKPRTILQTAGWKIRRSSNPVYHTQPDTWVDLETGEVMDKAAVRKAGVYIHIAESVSERMLRACILLSNCAPTERNFVRYVLKMRNGRGGLLDTLKAVLDRWIDHAYPDIRINYKARKRAALRAILYRRGILHDDQTLTRDFQLLRRSTKKENLGDGVRAALVLPIRSK